MLKAKKSTVVNASVNKVFNCFEVFLRYRERDGETYLGVATATRYPARGAPKAFTMRCTRQPMAAPDLP